MGEMGGIWVSLTGIDQSMLTRVKVGNGLGSGCGLGNFWAQSGFKSLDWFW